jgi:hypothetical protein
VQVLKMIDEYDLYGSVAYPKAHNQVRFSRRMFCIGVVQHCDVRWL